MPWRETPAEAERARAERPVKVCGPHGTLYGIYTPAAPDAPAAGSCVVWFTLPRSHRNRMWVEGARRMAARGFSGFRFDYHGVGDSEGESERVNPSRPYQGDALAVLRHLRGLGERRFVLFGSCFDACTALSAFSGEGDSIEAIAFLAAPVMDDENLARADTDRKDWRHLLRALRRTDNWRALGDPERWRYMSAVLGRLSGRTLRRVNGTPPLPLAPSFLKHFDALTRSRARALFLYGRDDREYQSFQHAERGLWPRLPAGVRERLELEIWDGEVHDGTLEIGKQRQILERVLAWIDQLHPDRTADRATAAGSTA